MIIPRWTILAAGIGVLAGVAWFSAGAAFALLAAATLTGTIATTRSTS